MKKLAILFISVFILQNLSAQEEETSLEQTTDAPSSNYRPATAPSASYNEAATATANSANNVAASAPGNAKKAANAPFDGGLTLVLAVGAAYGLKRVKNRKTA